MYIIEIWHPIDNKWIHLIQITKGYEREYFTDGQLIMVKKINDNGTIKTE